MKCDKYTFINLLQGLILNHLNQPHRISQGYTSLYDHILLLKFLGLLLLSSLSQGLQQEQARREQISRVVQVVQKKNQI